VATSIVEPLRAFGAYAQALDAEALGVQADDALGVQADDALGVQADDAAALLCYLGRRPDWTA
jgi:hypothetical protein